jgi:hypothetical protein
MKLALLIAGAFANVLVVLLLAPLFEGILRKLTARLQSRQGPPLRQPYFDLLKLLGKEDLETGELPGVQRAVTYLGLAAVLTTACLFPSGFPAPLNGAGDVILLIYLLTFCSVCTCWPEWPAVPPSPSSAAAAKSCASSPSNPSSPSPSSSAPSTRSFRIDTVLDGSVYAGASFPGRVSSCSGCSSSRCRHSPASPFRHRRRRNRDHGRRPDGILRTEARPAQVRSTGEARALQRPLCRSFSCRGAPPGISLSAGCCSG